MSHVRRPRRILSGSQTAPPWNDDLPDYDDPFCSRTCHERWKDGAPAVGGGRKCEGCSAHIIVGTLCAKCREEYRRNPDGPSSSTGTTGRPGAKAPCRNRNKLRPSVVVASGAMNSAGRLGSAPTSAGNSSSAAGRRRAACRIMSLLFVASDKLCVESMDGLGENGPIYWCDHNTHHLV